MLAFIKSAYGRFCVLLAAGMWSAYLGLQILIPVTLLLPVKVGSALGIAFPLLIFTASCIYVWPRTAYLRAENVVNSNKATIGIFLLTLALVAFPGSFVMPFAYAALSGRSETAMYAWFSIIGIPTFALLSIAGLALVKSAQPKKTT